MQYIKEHKEYLNVANAKKEYDGKSKKKKYEIYKIF